MKERYKEYKKSLQLFFHEYGKVTFVISSSIISVFLIWCIIFLITPKKLGVSFFDIGQGDAILLQTPSGKTLLVDGGPSTRIMERLGKELPYFTTDIDVMVSTHPDADHVTGLIPVLEKYAVHKIIMSPISGHTGVFDDLQKHIDEEETEVHIAETGDTIDFQDGVIAKILYPPQNYHEKKNDTNDASVSMEVMYGDETFLLTGDLPSIEEPKLISAGLDRSITVYKAGHHGSKYSSGEQLLTYIRPEYAVISAGKNNRYGHPSPETLERLEKYAKEIISTIDRGTISFVTDGRLMEIKTGK